MVPDGFRLPETDIQIDPVKGAFDLATRIRYPDHNDALGGVEWGHPSDNLGAIVAVMDWLSRPSHWGKVFHSGPELNVHTFPIAMINAYEIQGCFQVANSFNAVSIDHTILVKVASPAVTSWLFGLTENQALAALSQAWTDGHPLRTFRAAPNTIARKGWAAGDTCKRAVHLVMLTRAGQDGSLNPLTAERWGFYSSFFQNKEFDLPVPYGELIIHRTIIKLIACESHGLTAAEAALQFSKSCATNASIPLVTSERSRYEPTYPLWLLSIRLVIFSTLLIAIIACNTLLRWCPSRRPLLTLPTTKMILPGLLIRVLGICERKWCCAKIKHSRKTTMISTSGVLPLLYPYSSKMDHGLRKL